ncbi:putative oxidoreductase YxbG [Daldinia childiae]|uniref:putative oxidoreductase YxbG n=1 Tax=Daldinia childiae TaxID=326645 RepID=UPI001447D86D|nr:putative oxidoreductase YxbG [Daldinia childiae]KAF3065306.1 putative oxidoreductase YxbG [Daldinia childiae]
MTTSAANTAAVSTFISTTYTDTYEYISPKKLDLSGKSVFITGASKGVGRETALSYAKAGASGIIVGARSDLSSLVTEIKEAAKTAGRKTEPTVLSLKLDVTSEDSVKAAADAISTKFGGKLDILINNAGYLDDWAPIAEASTYHWWQTYEVNVKGVFLCSKYFIPLLLASEIKTNILTSSVGAIAVYPSASAYQSSKFAVSRLAEYVAAEYADQGLVCYSLHPGGIKTELATNMPKEVQDKVLTDEVALPADTLAWLGAERRPWMNGRFINVKWDMKELEARKDEIVEKDLLTFRLTTSA